MPIIVPPQELVVRVPVRVAWSMWTCPDDLVRFLHGVQRVSAVGERWRFRARVGGVLVDYEAEVRVRLPEARLVWRSVDGAETGGIVTFEELGPHATRVTLALPWAPVGTLTAVPDLVAESTRLSRASLAAFQALAEATAYQRDLVLT